MEGMEGMEAVAHNPPALKQQRDRAQKRGFSLIEAAFVLAVVGVVIGTIWVSAAAMYESHKVNKTVEGIFTTARNIQNLISLRDSEGIGGNVDITQLVLDAGSFPQDFVINGDARTPFGGTLGIRNLVGGANPRFDLRIDDIPGSICIKMLQKISYAAAIASQNGIGNYKDTLGFIQIFPRNVAVSVSSFPIDIPTATPMCAQQNNIIFFTFSYNRIN